MHKWGLLAFGAVLALIVLSSHAYAADLELKITDGIGNVIGTEQSPVEVCPCSPITPRTASVTVRNLGPATVSPELYQTLPEGFTGFIQTYTSEALEAGGQERLDGFMVSPGCSVAPGIYKITMRAENGITGGTASKDMYVKVLKCHYVSLEVNQTYRETCEESSEPVVYDIKIKNEGKFSETFNLSSDAGWASFSDSRLALGAGQEMTVQMIANAPDGVSGLRNIKVTAKSESYDSQAAGSYAQDSEALQLDVKNCYDFGLDLQPEKSEACIGKAAQYTLVISNTGLNADTYSIYGPEWASFQKNITIPPGSRGEVRIDAVAGYAGMLSLDMDVKSSGDVSLSKGAPASMNATECRDVVVIASPSEISACQGAPAKFFVSVRNRGTVEDTFELTTNLGSLEKTKVALGPDQSETVGLDVQTAGIAGVHAVEILASSAGVSDKTAVTLEVKNCYSAELGITPESKSICPCTSTDYHVTLKNTGGLADEYTVTFNGDITQQIALQPGESRAFDFSAPIVYGAKSRAVNVSAASDHVSLQDSAQLNIKPPEECFAVELATDEVINMEPCTSITVPINVTNRGEVAQIFVLSLDGPEWVSVSPDNVNLDPGKEKTVYLYISPPYEVETESYVIVLNATSPNMKISQEIWIDITPNASAATAGGAAGSATGNATGNATTNITLTLGNITGAIIEEGERPLWKTIIVAAITIIIVIILIVRFVVLVK